MSFAPPCRCACHYLCCGVSLVQLSAWLSPLGGAQYADNLSFTSEVLNHRAHVDRAPLSRHRRWQGRSSDLELEPVTPVCAQCQGDHVGPSPATDDLAAGENAPVRGSPSCYSH